MNPWTVCILLLSLLLLWPMLCQRVGKRRRVLLNTALACAAAFIILYATILTRTPGDYEVILTPFAAFAAALAALSCRSFRRLRAAMTRLNSVIRT